MAKTKTNVMRLLDAAGIVYDTAEYAWSEDDLSGRHAAETSGIEPEKMFKTLVLEGDKHGSMVCCIPVLEEVDLKKAARVSGNKKVELLPLKKLLPLTGYQRGGCSPVGMKKHFPTWIDETAQRYEHIAVSAGARGEQIIVNPKELAAYVEAEFADLLK